MFEIVETNSFEKKTTPQCELFVRDTITQHLCFKGGNTSYSTMDDYDSQRKPLLSESGRYKLYTDSTDSSINVNVEIQKPGSGVTFRKHITLFGAIGILTGINFRIHSCFRI